ncbi:hypothetical protein CRP5_000059 [Riemerella phage vB_RanS_CRP5]|nr:hypothetical protein CRP5_000059 [Riemerella phage vB_RanS_CRP5]
MVVSYSICEGIIWIVKFVKIFKINREKNFFAISSFEIIKEFFHKMNFILQRYEKNNTKKY